MISLYNSFYRKETWVTKTKSILILCGEEPHLDPRTKWHAEFFKDNGYHVDIISYVANSHHHTSLPIYKLASIQNFSLSQLSLLILYIKKLFISDLIKTKLSFVILIILLFPILLIYRPISIIKRKYGIKKNCLDYSYKIFFFLKQHIILSSKLYLYNKTPNIIICQEPHTLSAGIYQLKKKSFIIFDAHEISYDEEIGQDQFTSKILKNYEEHLLQKINYFTTVSDEIMKLYIKNNPHLKNISCTIPNVNSKKHIINNQISKTSKKIKFLLSSSYFTNKGLEEFITAWKIVNPDNATLYLRLFNPDRFNKNFQQTLSKLKGEYKNIVILPKIPQDKIILSYTNYDVGVIFYNPNLNLNYKYCCPNKFGEYLFSGLAILSTNSSFLSRQINSAKCGITYDPNNQNNTINALKTLISNPEQIKTYQQNSRKFAKTKFHYEIFGKKLLKDLGL